MSSQDYIVIRKNSRFDTECFAERGATHPAAACGKAAARISVRRVPLAGCPVLCHPRIVA